MRIFRNYMIISLLLLLFLFAGCRSSGPAYHISQDVDFSFFKRVAVMPLDNLSSQRSAGEIIRQLVISELLASGLVEVVVPGEVMSAVNELGIQNISSLNKDQIEALGRALNVEAVIMGTVEQYGEVRFGSISAPEVTITLMMADTATGNIIWSCTLTRGGAGFMARHFGAKSKTLTETALVTVRDAIRTLASY